MRRVYGVVRGVAGCWLEGGRLLRYFEFEDKSDGGHDGQRGNVVLRRENCQGEMARRKWEAAGCAPEARGKLYLKGAESVSGHDTGGATREGVAWIMRRRKAVRCG